MADHVCHFDVEQDGETITRHAPLKHYHKNEDGTGFFRVRIDGEIKEYDMDQLNKIKWQRYEDDSQKEMFGQ